MQRLKAASPCLDLMNSPVKLLFRQIYQISDTFTATANINRQVRGKRWKKILCAQFTLLRRQYWVNIYWVPLLLTPHQAHWSASQPVIETKTFVCCSPTTFKPNWKIISKVEILEIQFIRAWGTEFECFKINLHF